jgi:formamidopyrimidine-DNA glycosylase
MIELSLIAITWYITKVYYTKEFRVSLNNLSQDTHMQATCSNCAQTIITHRENMRNPFYCMLCK